MKRQGEDPEDQKRAATSEVRPGIRATLLCLALVPIFLYFLPVTVGTAVGSSAGRPLEPARHGTGDVRECSRIGPVSRSGFGLWWTCQVAVSWDDGGHGDYSAAAGEFSRSDVGRSFRVELGGLGWDSTRSATVDKIPDRYVVLRSGVERPGWPHPVTLVMGIPLACISFLIAFLGLSDRWTDFTKVLRARLPRR